MSASLTWSGLRELAFELGGLPERVRPVAAEKLLAGANRAAASVRQQYDAIPRREFDKDGPGLSKGVKVDASDPLAPRVLNRSFHAHLYEFGTGPRSVADGTPVRVKVNGQWVTVKGTGRGSMPAANVFVPTIERERERVAGELGDVLRDPRVTGGLRTMAVR